MAKPKLLLIEQYAQVGGGQVVFLMLANILSQESIDLTLAYPQQGDLHRRVQSQMSTVATVNMPNMQGSGWLGKFIVVLKNLIAIPVLMRAAQGKTQLYLNGMRLLPAALMAALLMRKPLIVHVHLVYAKHILRWLAWLSRLGLIQRLVFCSEYCFEAFCQVGSSQHAVLLTNALGQAARQVKPGFAASGFKTVHCGFFGRPTVDKGIETITAMARQFAAIAFDCYGAADFQSEAQVDYPHNCHQHHKVDSVVHTIVAQGINVVLVPSVRPESFGLIAIEAMAAGAIVMVRNSGGLSEIARYTGALSFSKDSELPPLLQRIIDMSPAARAALARQQHQQTLKHYDVMQFRKTLLSDIITMN